MTPLLAQAHPDWLTPLSTFGVGGTCLAFFMYFQVQWARRIEVALNRVSKSNALLVLSLHQINDEARRQAKQIIIEVDRAEKRVEAAE